MHNSTVFVFFLLHVGANRIHRLQKCAFVNFLKSIFPSMRSLPMGSFLLTENLCAIEIFSHLGCYTACIASKLQKFRDNLPVPSSRVKQDNGGKNCHSTLRKAPKVRRSHFIVHYTFPVKPVLFLMETQHCSK